MRSVIFAAIAIPLLLLAMAFASPTAVSFVSSSWENAKSKAESESKLFFVDFDASYCASCRAMDESTYQDPALSKYIDDNVVALRLDVQDFDGVMWSQKYEVEALPTMLIFDDKGKLVKRLVGYKSAQELLKEFRAVSSGTTNTPKVQPAPQPIEEDKPIVRASTNVKPEKKAEEPKVVFSGFGTTSNSNKNKSKELYEIDIRKVEKSEGYSVQVGVFSSQEALLRQTAKMKKLFPDQVHMIYVYEARGKEMTKLLLGNFSVRSSANALLQKVKGQGVEALIKDLRYL